MYVFPVPEQLPGKFRNSAITRSSFFILVFLFLFFYFFFLPFLLALTLSFMKSEINLRFIGNGCS